MFLFSRISVMDPLLLFGVSLSALGVVRAGRSRADSVGDLVCFYGGMIIGTMAKGLPGFVFPIMLVAAWIITNRSFFLLRRMWDWRAATVALALIVPWHVAVGYLVPGFYSFYFGDNQVWRYLGSRSYVEEGRGLTTIAFWLVTFCVGFPWTPYFFSALQAGRCHLREARYQFLLIWLAGVIGMFSVSSFKLEYYALPAFPAAILLIVGLFGDCRLGVPTETCVLRAVRLWTVLALVGGVGFCGVIVWAWIVGLFTPLTIVHGLTFWSTNYRMLLDYPLPLPEIAVTRYAQLLLTGGVIWVAGFAMAWSALRKRVHRMQVVFAVALVGCGICIVCGMLLKEIGPHHSVRPIAARLNTLLQNSDIIVHERGLEKSGGLLFHIRRQVLVLNGAKGDLEFGSRQPGSKGLFISTAEFETIWRGSTRAFLITDLPPARSALADVGGPGGTLLISTGTRWLYVNHIAS